MVKWPCASVRAVPSWAPFAPLVTANAVTVASDTGPFIAVPSIVPFVVGVAPPPPPPSPALLPLVESPPHAASRSPAATRAVAAMLRALPRPSMSRRFIVCLSSREKCGNARGRLGRPPQDVRTLCPGKRFGPIVRPLGNGPASARSPPARADSSGFALHQRSLRRNRDRVDHGDERRRFTLCKCTRSAPRCASHVATARTSPPPGSRTPCRRTGTRPPSRRPGG